MLASLMTIGPLSVDMYLPGFPNLSRELGASVSLTQLTLTAFLLGLGSGQLVAGPVSDALGRKRPLLFGLGCYVIVTLLCAVAPSIGTLIAARLLQGLSAGALVVIAMAVVRDRYAGREAASFFSMMMLVQMVSPLFAPSVGALVVSVASWREIFLLLAVIGVLVSLAAGRGLGETLPPERRRPGGLANAGRTIGRLLRDRSFMSYAASSGIVNGAVFVYIGGSSFVLQEVYGLTPVQFAFVFACGGLSVIATSLLNRQLLHHAAPRTLFRAGLAAQLLASMVLLLVTVTRADLVPFLIPVMLMIGASQLVGPNANAVALTEHPEVAGTAAAILGTLRFGIGALAAPLAGIAGSATALPLGILMFGLALSGSLAYLFLRTEPIVDRARRVVIQ